MSTAGTTRGLLTVGLLFHVAVIQPVRGDCEGGPIFPETIYAQDTTTFAWQTTMDVDFAKGYLQQLSNYTIWSRGQLAGATVLTSTSDNPATGSGFFYLVKTTGSPCGSWQTSGGEEPLRDKEIPPGCTDVNPSEQDLQDAVDAGLAVAPDAWGNPDSAMAFHETSQDDLGCAFETSETPSATSASEGGALFYCGPTIGDAEIVWPTGPCLNAACYAHDYCYLSNCVGDLCFFSGQTDAAGCDEPLLDIACDPVTGCLSEDGPFWYLNNLFVCLLANGSTLNESNPFCEDSPCFGSTCDSSSSLCNCHLEATNWWPADGSPEDVAGEDDGALLNGTTFEPGQVNQAFSFDGINDYVDLGNIYSGNLNIPFSIAMWVKRSDDSTATLFKSHDHSEFYYGTWLLYEGGPLHRLQISFGDGGSPTASNRRTKLAVVDIPIGEWTHIVAVVRSWQSMSLYVNGVDKGGNYSGGATSMNHGTLKPALLAHSSLGHQYFGGALDEVAVFRCALTEEEVQVLMTGGGIPPGE